MISLIALVFLEHTEQRQTSDLKLQQSGYFQGLSLSALSYRHEAFGATSVRGTTNLADNGLGSQQHLVSRWFPPPLRDSSLSLSPLTFLPNRFTIYAVGFHGSNEYLLPFYGKKQLLKYLHPNRFFQRLQIKHGLRHDMDFTMPCLTCNKFEICPRVSFPLNCYSISSFGM